MDKQQKFDRIMRIVGLTNAKAFDVMFGNMTYGRLFREADIYNKSKGDLRLLNDIWLKILQLHMNNKLGDLYLNSDSLDIVEPLIQSLYEDIR